jgi:hypothetical protein
MESAEGTANAGHAMIVEEPDDFRPTTDELIDREIGGDVILFQ